METERFDAIIIGAGMAGLSAAYTLAKAGKSVLVIERGDTAGGKNVSGGRVYSYALEKLEPGLSARAPLERAVTHEQIMLLDEERSVLVDYGDPSFGEKTALSYTVLRAPFDEWFAGEVEALGAFIAAGVRVDSLVEQDGRITGVRAGEDEMLADVIIAADGVNSLIAQQAGLRADARPSEVGVGVKEVIELPAEEIEARFHLEPGQGAARMILGGSFGVSGGTFLYTNQTSLSLGCVFLPADLAEKRISVHDLLQRIKCHPDIRCLIEGGKTVEYGAHLVPEGGWRSVPSRLYRPGLLVVGDAAGLAINQGFTVRGMDLAVLSGLAAGQAVLMETNADQIGPAYHRLLAEYGIKAGMEQYIRFPEMLENPRLFTDYPAAAADVFHTLYAINEANPTSPLTGVIGAVRRKIPMRTLLKDGWQMWRTLK